MICDTCGYNCDVTSSCGGSSRKTTKMCSSVAEAADKPCDAIMVGAVASRSHRHTVDVFHLIAATLVSFLSVL